jgi:SAM-dependent methyltransferase
MPLVSADIRTVRDTYDRLAAFYDKDTAAIHHGRWVGLYQELIVRYGAPGCQLVDLGCGTGKSALVLASLGYRVTGVDLSPEMLRVAAAKPGADRIRLTEGDLRDLPDLGTFDVATCVFEPMCYLQTDADLLATFRGVFRLLAPGGLFLFDLGTAGYYHRLQTTPLVLDHGEEFVIWRASGFAGPGDLCHLDVDRFLREEEARWRRRSYRHTYRHHTPQRVATLLADSGLRMLGEHGVDDFGNLGDSLDDEVHHKVIRVCRKQAAG